MSKTLVMLSSRAASRLPRNPIVRSSLRQLRHESSSTSSSTSTGSAGITPGLIGGLAGGGLVFLGGYSWYYFSGAKTMVNTAQKTQATFKQYGQKFKDATPEPNEALEWLRDSAQAYASFIPGGKGFVDSAFNDLDAIRHKHGKEVDSIVKEAYDELKDISHEGLNLTTAQKAWSILQKHLMRIGDLAGSTASDIINNHPVLKDKVGGNLDQLKQMGDRYGPEAKKQVDETWGQIQEVVKSGVSAQTIPKIQKLVQDKIQKMQELGSKMWDEGMEKAKPFLDKSPEVKKLVEENKEKLKKQGNVQELYEKVKDAVQSGRTDSLKEYVQNTVNNVKQASGGSSSSGGLEKYLNMVPGGGEIIPKLTQMQQIAQEHGKEAEDIAKETYREIQEVLQKRVSQAQELAQKAEKKAKRD